MRFYHAGETLTREKSPLALPLFFFPSCSCWRHQERAMERKPLPEGVAGSVTPAVASSRSQNQSPKPNPDQRLPRSPKARHTGAAPPDTRHPPDQTNREKSHTRTHTRLHEQLIHAHARQHVNTRTHTFTHALTNQPNTPGRHSRTQPAHATPDVHCLLTEIALRSGATKPTQTTRATKETARSPASRASRA